MKKPIDLIEKCKGIEATAINKIENYKGYTDIHKDFKKNQVITFFSGYNKDILYKSKILGFDINGEIYVLWECYWVSIKDDDIRKIIK